MTEPVLRDYAEIKLKASRPCHVCRQTQCCGWKMIRKKMQAGTRYTLYVCPTCEEKLKRGEIKPAKTKFSIGDLVKYRMSETGNPDLEGLVGTVIYVDTRDYTVEFGHEIHDGITDYRAREIGIEPKFERGWFCREEHLEEAYT